MLQKETRAAMALAALGVVYGDIGTSPLYTLKQSFSASALPPDKANVLGFVSLIFWALLLIVTFKYVLILLRADNKGEGGIVVLMQQAAGCLKGKSAAIITLIGLTGAALFYGDAMITPAISVLSAVEGLSVANPAWTPWIIPISLAVLFVLFRFQRYGTQRVERLFGFIMLMWFVVLALTGLIQIIGNLQILQAFNPVYGLSFALHAGWESLAGLGAVVLAVTGAEVLFADIGHFGRKPIQRTWITLVLPALMLNYAGQGALLLNNPAAVHNPFFRLVPENALIPLVVLAVVVAVIAGQAVISGTFSLTRQAIQLGYLPRLSIIHNGSNEIRRIFIPTINRILFAAVVVLVFAFHDSGHLAAAYGVAVTGTMGITTILLYIVMAHRWHIPKVLALMLTGGFMLFDVFFFSANLLKIFHGGWLPISIAAVMMLTYTTWKRGRALLENRQKDHDIPLDDFLQNLEAHPPQMVSGTAVYLVSNPFVIPPALLHNLKHNKVLHERNILLMVQTKETPFVDNSDRMALKHLSRHFTRIIANFGFQETPNIAKIMPMAAAQGMNLELSDTSFFLSRHSIQVLPGTPDGHMGRWRSGYFKWLYKNSTPSTDFYRIPGNRVVELGTQVSI